MKLVYRDNGETIELFHIITNHSMSVDDALALMGICEFKQELIENCIYDYDFENLDLIADSMV